MIIAFAIFCVVAYVLLAGSSAYIDSATVTGKRVRPKSVNIGPIPTVAFFFGNELD
jgi:hypothetical protein